MQTVDCPKAALFDLDDTLALSFESPAPEMIERLLRLLPFIPVAIITGRDFPWMQRDFLPQFAHAAHTDRFFVFPEASAQCLQFDQGSWKELYGQTLSDEEKLRISAAIIEAATETGLLEAVPAYGERIRLKRAMVAYAVLGVAVPKDLKYTWDPGNVRRLKLRDAIARKLPQYDVVLGGATSVDVTKRGVNKTLGVRWLAQHLRLSPADMLYVGDALFPGGNDYVVMETGIRTRTTSGPAETAAIIDELLLACAAC